MIEHRDADLSGSRLRNVDLSGTRVKSAYLRNVAIVDAWVQDTRIEGHVVSLTVNGVEVADYVEGELDRRFPERLRLRPNDVAGAREAWAEAVARTDDAVERARRLPPALLDERVDDEFSFVQTLRHLVFAYDRWLTGPVFADPAPYFHPIGQTHEGALEGIEQGIDPDLRPSLDEVIGVRLGQRRRLDELLDASTDVDLRRVVESPNGGTTDVISCIGVVLHEEWWHHRYADRDLTVIEATMVDGDG